MVYAVGFCLWWWLRLLHVAYEADDASLRVMRRGRVVSSYETALITDFTMRGVVETKNFLTAVVPPPDWPRGVIELRGERGASVVLLPELLLFGRRPVEDAAEGLRSALGLEPRA